MISDKQNEEEQLNLLAAMREVYSSAKRLIAIQFAFGVPFSVLLAVVVIAFPSLKVWSVFIGLAVAVVIELGLEPTVKSRSKLGAQIQELFDCVVLELKWNKYRAGSEPDVEDVFTRAKKYFHKYGPHSGLRDWYSTEVDEVPIVFARFICQQSNLRWDVELRRRYRTAIYVILGALFALLIVVALATKQTLTDTFLHVLGPMSPALLWGIKEVRKQDAAMEGLRSLKATEDRVWKEMLSETNEDIQTMAAREIQNEIFSRRSSNPLIFDFFYKVFLDCQEEELKVRAHRRVQEVIAALKIREGTK